MGTWGALAFDNDRGCDWASSFARTKDLKMASQALSAVMAAEKSYLSANDACEALAACEVLARLQGNWGARNPYTKGIDDWVVAHPIQVPRGLVKLAYEVIDRIRGPHSELADLWGEGKLRDEWLDAVANLELRIKLPPKQ